MKIKSVLELMILDSVDNKKLHPVLADKLLEYVNSKNESQLRKLVETPQQNMRQFKNIG